MGRAGGRRRPMVIAAAAVATVLVAVGLYWFEPWKLWQEVTIREALPRTTASASAQAAPETLARGTLISHEHTTSGTARVLRLPDGSRILRLEGLDTSNGPDLRVWLTDAPVKEGTDGWYVFDDGKHVSLGALKGNKGDQNYPIPADVNLSEYTSVSIWCDRFDVSFGAAALTPV
ncbi:DM13 domain-containing protein [Streptomyces sp. NPDC127110]|uniref:DM13 domain-containing protein n=1 Tax=Streptomyces sp. NPDC127110 TaxID=3345362 RepID=UPI0036282A29